MRRRARPWPARIGRVAGHGRALAAGEPAHVTLVDPAARRTVEPSTLASRSRKTPYAGMALPGRVVATFLRHRPPQLDGEAHVVSIPPVGCDVITVAASAHGGTRPDGWR